MTRLTTPESMFFDCRRQQMYEQHRVFYFIKGCRPLPRPPRCITDRGGRSLKNESIIIEDNAKKFANKIIYLCHNKRIRDKLAKNNYKIITCNYSKNILIKDGLKILKKI